MGLFMYEAGWGPRDNVDERVAANMRGTAQKPRGGEELGKKDTDLGPGDRVL